MIKNFDNDKKIFKNQKFRNEEGIKQTHDKKTG